MTKTLFRVETPEQRLGLFLDKVTVGHESGCWMWTGGYSGLYYGSFYDGTRNVRAHRWSYERFVGPIAEGLVLDHLCRIQRCVNPAHLEPVTQIENMRRGVRARKSHCKRGHEFTKTNTYLTAGRRTCRACVRERQAIYRQRTQGDRVTA